MTSQQQADILLAEWQEQRRARESDDPIMILLPEPAVKEINPWQFVIPIMGWLWAGAFLLAVALI